MSDAIYDGPDIKSLIARIEPGDSDDEWMPVFVGDIRAIVELADEVIRTRYDDGIHHDEVLDDLDHMIGHPYPNYAPRCWKCAPVPLTDRGGPK